MYQLGDRGQRFAVQVDLVASVPLRDVEPDPRHRVEDVSGKRYATAHDRWIARAATLREAELLRLPQGAPVMHLIHVARSDDDALLEVSESVWPADRIEVIDEYAVAHQAEQAQGLSDI